MKTVRPDAATTGDNALVEIYRNQLLKISEQKKELESRVAGYTPLSATETFRTAMTRGREFFKNPGILWKIGTLAQKKRLLQILFLDKPQWNAENRFRTARMPRIFNKNTAQTDGKSSLAAHVKLNANEIIAEIINISETLTDADIALYTSANVQSAKSPIFPV